MGVRTIVASSVVVFLAKAIHIMTAAARFAKAVEVLCGRIRYLSRMSLTGRRLVSLVMQAVASMATARVLVLLKTNSAATSA